MPAPLEGILVLDLSLGLQGPYCGMLLADMGAEVIKIERPDVGEGMRYMYLHHIEPGLGVSWAGANRGKQSLALDIRPEGGREVFLKLVARADVVVQNFRPGVMERLGYGYTALSAVNPRLIMASLSGYGETGPHAHRAGQDMLAQAYSGLIALQGYADGEPQAVGAPIADGIGALTGAWGVALALFARERTGRGQELTSNLADALLAICPMEWADYLYSGKQGKGGRGWYTNLPYGPWRARDRDVVINMQGEIGWPEFCAVLGLPEVEHDPRFASNVQRVAHRREFEAIVAPRFRTRDAAEWRALFEAVGLRCDPVYGYADLEADPQTAVNQMIVTQQHPGYGAVRTVGQAVKLKDTPGTAAAPSQLPPPRFAEHTEAILRGLGYDAAAIAALEADGVVNTRGLGQGERLEKALGAIRGRRRAASTARLL